MVRVVSEGGTSTSLLTTTGKDRLVGRDPHAPIDKKKPIKSNDSSNGSIFGGESRSSILAGTDRYMSNVTGRMWEALLCGPETRNKKDRDQNAVNAGSLWLRRTGCGADTILGLVDFSSGRPSLNRDELKRRIGSVLKNEADVLSEGVKDALIANLAKATGTDPSTLVVAIGQARTIIKTGKPKDAQEFMALLGTIAGSDALIEVLDLSAEMAILDYAMSRAVDLGIPDAIDIILSSIKDNSLAREMVLRNLRQAAIRSDMKTLQKGIDYVGGAGVLYRVPDIIRLILINYRVDEPKENWDIPKRHKELTYILNSIDPFWRVTNRGKDEVSSLSNFVGISTDARVILNHDDDYFIQTTLGQTYSFQSKQEIVNLYHNNLNLSGR